MVPVGAAYGGVQGAVGNALAATAQLPPSASRAFSMAPAGSTGCPGPANASGVSRTWSSCRLLRALAGRVVCPPHRAALELDAVGVVEQAVADGVGLVGVADDGVPVGDGQLAGDERRGAFGAVLDDLGGVSPLGVAQRREHPVVDGEQVELGQAGEQRFEHLDDGQAYLDRWDRRWADTRIHGTTKRQVAAMFAEERPALGPLPLEPFRYYQYGRRTVHLDGCVEVASAYYSAPPGWIGRRVDVQWDAVHVRPLDPRTGQLLGEHLRAPRGWHRIADQDRPARTPPKTLALLAAAKRAGPGIATLCDHIYRHDGAAGVRRILGVLALAKKHGPVVVEQAAAAALELGMPTYRFLKRYLDRRPAPPLSLRQVDPLIRQLTLYRDLIDRRTGDPS